MDDLAEESYWRFDARRKGYGPWKETPQPERDAYKAEIAALRAQLEQAQADVERVTADRDARRERQYAEMLEWRGISEHDNACKSCWGSGCKTYGSTSTWRGGGGGQMMTVSVCDACWGSGMADKPWPSWRKTEATIARQREWIQKAGHRPECAALRADVPEGWHESDDSGPDVIILPGSCDCGYSELVGG